MSKISVVARLSAQPGKRDELLAALQPLIDGAVDEPGTLLYVFNTDAQDPDVLWIYEQYADQAAFEAHSSSPAMKQAGGSLGSLVAGPPELHFGAPVAGKGL